MTDFFVSLHVRMSYVPLHSWRIFSLDNIILSSHFMKHLKNVPLSFGLLGFWWEICSHSNCFSSKVKHCPLSCFQDFSLSSFTSLIMIYLGMDFFRLYPIWGSIASWIYRFTYYARFRKVLLFCRTLFQSHVVSPLC